MGLSTGLLLVSALLLFVVIKPEERRKSKKSIPECKPASILCCSVDVDSLQSLRPQSHSSVTIASHPSHRQNPTLPGDPLCPSETASS